ncbi:MAG: DUF6048 family protein [Flavobacterium sp.]|jgi:hypothetical protein
MKLKFILKYFFSISIYIFSISIKAQDTTAVSIKSFPQKYGIRLGLDLHKIAQNFYEKDYKGYEIVADYRVHKKYYAAVELGTENKTIADDRINFTTKGSYIKIGGDFNFYENWLDMNNSIYIGARYGTSIFSQTVNSYFIYDRNNYFPTTEVSNVGQKYDNLSAHWSEIVVGIKAEIFTNLFIGISGRLHILFSQTELDNFANLHIPGFNRTYEGSFGSSFNYTLSYLIPLKKK